MAQHIAWGHTHLASQLAGLQCGVVACSTAAGNTYTDTYMEFPEPYNAPPVVTVCLRTDVGATDADFGRLTLAVASVSKIGVLIRAYNAASTARAFSASWIVIGDMTPGRPSSADGVMVLDAGRLDEAILGGAYGELLLDAGSLDEAILG